MPCVNHQAQTAAQFVKDKTSVFLNKLHLKTDYKITMTRIGTTVWTTGASILTIGSVFVVYEKKYLQAALSFKYQNQQKKNSTAAKLYLIVISCNYYVLISLSSVSQFVPILSRMSISSCKSSVSLNKLLRQPKSKGVNVSQTETVCNNIFGFPKAGTDQCIPPHTSSKSPPHLELTYIKGPRTAVLFPAVIQASWTLSVSFLTLGVSVQSLSFLAVS